VPPYLAALVPIAIVLAVVFVVLVRGRRRTRRPRPAREPSGFVLLEGNLWDACTVDDVLRPWGRYTTEPVRGFCGVPPGRHRIRTTTASGEATLDFVLYPGEVLAWRLDADRARWEPHDLDADTRGLLEGAPLSGPDVGALSRSKLPGWLVHLRSTLGGATGRIPRLRDEVSRLSTTRGEGEGFDRLRKRLAKVVTLTEEGGGGDALEEARGIGETIVGRPLEKRDMRMLVQPVRDVANRHARIGDVERAMRVLALGLAVLPGDPELMVIAGCALATRGEPDEALRVLNAALERDRCLDAEDVARAMRARMELRSRLGHGVRV
jgi:hypothetical protein